MKKRMRLLSCLMAAALAATGVEPVPAAAAREFGWEEENGNWYWYENGIKQGTEGRGKEIYDPDSDAWYWLDAVQGGALTTNKDVYQESLAGDWGDTTNAQGERIGKWVRYDENGHMIKGWNTNESGTYYFDTTFGTMAKGTVTIDGKQYNFDENSGILQSSPAPVTDGWVTEDGVSYWYENGVKQGTEGRGKEIYDPDSDAWYWLDAVQGGALTRNKDVYQESLAGDWGDNVNAQGERIGKWVRYDENGHMIKGWNTNDNGTYYFDLTYGTMAKGTVQIEGKTYIFDAATGVLQGEGGTPTHTPVPTATPTAEPTATPTTAPTATPVPGSEKGSLGIVEEGESVKYSGEWKGLDWKITDRGKLIVNGSLTEEVKNLEWDKEKQEYIKDDSWLAAPWKAYDEETQTAYMDFTGATSLEGLFFLGYQKTQIGFLIDIFSKIKEMDLRNLDTSQVTSMEKMFYGCANLVSLDLRGFDTSQVTSMWSMFNRCSGLTSLDLSSFNTSQVTDMGWMFYNCSSLTSLDLSSFDTSQVTSMSSMFEGCNGLTSLALSSFNTSQVTSMKYMFYRCSGLTSLDLGSFDTSQVTDMGWMFYNCSSLATIYVGPGWQEAPYHSNMFSGCGTDHVTLKQ